MVDMTGADPYMMTISEALAEAAKIRDDGVRDAVFENLAALVASDDITSASEGETAIYKDSDIFPARPFPFDALPRNLLRTVGEFAEHLHVEPELIASAALTILSGAIGNTVRISPKEGFEVAPFLWLIIVASSGYGKSPAIETLLRPVKRRQAIAYEAYKSELRKYESWLRKTKSEGDVDPPEKPKLRHFFVSDITVEAMANVFEDDGRGVILALDEIAGLVTGLNQYKRRQGSDRQHYLELFNCGPWKVDRKTGVKFIPNTGASVIGGIQPRVLPQIFGADAFDDGLLPRFLLLRVADRPLRFCRTSASAWAVEFWSSLIDRCYSIPLTIDEAGFARPKRITLNDEALDVFEKYYNECGERALALSEKGAVFIPKLAAYYALKFAGVLHIIKELDGPSAAISADTIDKATMQAATDLCAFFAGQAMSALALYEPETTLTEHQKRLIITLHTLQNEVSCGRLLLSKIVDHYSKGLPKPAKLTAKKIGGMLRELGLTTRKSTDNQTFLVWEDGKIKGLFSKAKLISLDERPKVPLNSETPPSTEPLDPLAPPICGRTEKEQGGWSLSQVEVVS